MEKDNITAPAEKKIQIGKWYTRPFTEADLQPIPDDWLIGPPHYVGIGIPKAGTSWWSKLLLEHPQVRNNRLKAKELAYFCHFGYQGLTAAAAATYKKAFAAPPGCICGEWSPLYFNFPLAVEHLARTVPHVKLMAIVRNPLDRVPSSLNQMLSLRFKYMELEGDRAYFYKQFSLFQEAINCSLLYHPFKKLLDLFDRTQLLILQYEKCKANPAGEIARTYRFLGIDDKFNPPSLLKPVNKRPYIVPRPTPEERNALKNYFLEDVKAFGKLFPEIDLTLWEDFNK
jgi:hypothetical protein